MTSLPPLDDKSPADSSAPEEKPTPAAPEEKTTPAVPPSNGAAPRGGFPDEGEKFAQLDESEQVRLVLDDFQVAYRLEREGAFEAYPGEWVAVLRGQFVGHDPDERKLRRQVAAERNVHPERI